MALSLRLPDELEARLQNLAQATGRTKTWFVTQAICEQLDDLEDFYLAEQRALALREGRTKAVPLADIMKRYGLEG